MSLQQVKEETTESTPDPELVEAAAKVLQRLQEVVADRTDTSTSAMDTSGPKPPELYVIVCDKEGGEAVELPLEQDGTLSTETLQIEYRGALGLKYR